MTAWGTIPPEPPRESSLDGCAPKLAAAVRAVEADMRGEGYDPTIFETLRTNARQNWLAGFGRRYDDGRGIITHAVTVWSSWHGFGLAADVISAAHQWDASPMFWAALGEAAARHGLVWGGSWRMKDLPHLQVGPPARTTPSPRAKQLYDQGGLEAVWREVGAI